MKVKARHYLGEILFGIGIALICWGTIDWIIILRYLIIGISLCPIGFYIMYKDKRRELENWRQEIKA